MCDQLAVMYAGRVVESGPVSRIFNAPAHPYTEALLNSIAILPRLGNSWFVTAPGRALAGCRLQLRNKLCKN